MLDMDSIVRKQLLTLLNNDILYQSHHRKMINFKVDFCFTQFLEVHLDRDIISDIIMMFKTNSI